MKRHRKQISLNGTWKFRTDPDGMGDASPDVVRNTIGATAQECKFFDPAFDDRHWGEITVPACWQAEGHRYNGVAWYRTRFDYRAGDATVVRLAFQGVDYFADAWINGYYLGSHEGFFNHFTFDVSRWIRAGENLLVVRVESPKDANVKVGPTEKTVVKGALQDWDCNNLDINPGGIFADVRLIESRAIAVDRVKATPYVDAEGRQARVHCKVTLVNPDREVKQVSLSARVAPDNFAGPENGAETEIRQLVPGTSEHELWVEVAEPRLWWPWDMGEQHLYRFTVTATGGAGGEVLDEVSDRIGLRHLRQVPGTWQCYVNGKRIFCRGPNYLSEQLQSNMTRAKYEADVRLMREANMNMVRVYCVVEQEEFYDICDEQGMLVLQDFPAQGPLSDSSDMVRRAVPQGRDMVNQLYHHPSIIIWALGEQPSIENFEKLCMALVTAAGEEDPTRFLQQGACVWEWEIARRKYDWPIDYHLLCGWFPPDMNYLIKPFRTLPDSEGPAGSSVADLAIKKRSLLEFIGEFGPPESLPNLESLRRFLPEKELWPLDWKALERRCLHGDILLRWIPEPHSLQQLIDDSQAYQAFLYKYHVEFYRRHKFDPCNGCLFFHFKDCWPAITASVVDYYGEKKKAWYTLRQAFSPLHVMMEWPDLEGESAGATLRKAVHVVNDYHRPCESLTVQWQVVDAGGAVVAGGSIACGIADNGIAAVGEVVWQVPADATEQYTIRLRLGAADQHVSANEYPVRVRPGRSPWAARADHRAAAVPGAARPGHVSGRQHGDAAAHPHRARHAGLRRDAGVGRPAHPLRAPGERIGWRCSRLARPGPVRGGGGARLQLRRRRPPRRRRPLPVAVGSCAMRPEKGAFDAAGIANYVVSGDPMACTRPGAAACPWGPPESGRRFMTTADIESRLKELHGLPTPVRLWIVEMGPDSTDEPAVWVWIVLEREYDEVDPKERADLRELVRAAVREWVGDEAHWVYVRFHDGVLSGAAS